MDQFKVVVAERAKNQILRSVDFLSRVSPQAAGDLYEAIMASLRSLETMPERYPAIHDLFISGKEVRRAVIQQTYAALYIVKGSAVYVDYFLDNREDNRWIFETIGSAE